MNAQLRQAIRAAKAKANGGRKKFIKKPKDGLPVLAGTMSETGQSIMVWCPACNRYHLHGWHKDLPAWSLHTRLAHCDAKKTEAGEPKSYYIRRLPNLPHYYKP